MRAPAGWRASPSAPDRDAAPDAPAGDRGLHLGGPPANNYDFTFLAPCPSSGLIIHGDADRVVPMADTKKLVDKLKTQKGITITHDVIPGADHLFGAGMEEMIGTVEAYVKRRMTEGGR